MSAWKRGSKRPGADIFAAAGGESGFQWEPHVRIGGLSLAKRGSKDFRSQIYACDLSETGFQTPPGCQMFVFRVGNGVPEGNAGCFVHASLANRGSRGFSREGMGAEKGLGQLWPRNVPRDS